MILVRRRRSEVNNVDSERAHAVYGRINMSDFGNARAIPGRVDGFTAVVVFMDDEIVIVLRGGRRNLYFDSLAGIHPIGLSASNGKSERVTVHSCHAGAFAAGRSRAGRGSVPGQRRPGGSNRSTGWRGRRQSAAGHSQDEKDDAAEKKQHGDSDASGKG